MSPSSHVNFVRVVYIEAQHTSQRTQLGRRRARRASNPAHLVTVVAVVAVVALTALPSVDLAKLAAHRALPVARSVDISDTMAVAVARVPRPLLHQAARIARTSAPSLPKLLTPRRVARLSRLTSLYTLTLLTQIRLVLLRRLPSLLARQVSRLTTPVVASRLLRKQVRANVRRVLSRLLQQLALRAVLGLLPLGLSPMILSALSALVGSAASNAAALLAAQVVALLPQEMVTRVLEEIRAHAGAVRETIGEEVSKRIEGVNVAEYIGMIEWGRFVEYVKTRVELENLVDLPGMREMISEWIARVSTVQIQEVAGEWMARVVAVAGEGGILASPKAILAT